MTGQALIVQGNALRLPLRDGSVDTIITSPPYAFLRAYDTGYPHLEVGAEATPAEFLEHLWQATAEMVRVLKPTGSIFVDLGDKYSGNETGGRYDPAGTTLHNPANVWKQQQRRSPYRSGQPPKSLMLLPERYRIGCVDQLGLIARAVICWSKPNGLPESVTDRVRRSHEDWVHLYKHPRYYSAIDEVREAYEAKPQRRFSPRFTGRPESAPPGINRQRTGYAEVWEEPSQGGNPLGKLPGSVWTIPSEPLRLPDHLGVQHYAAFPSEWPRRLILGWSPPGICVDCGQGRVPVVEREAQGRGRNGAGDGGRGNRLPGYQDINRTPWQEGVTATILGYACACTPHTNHPGVYMGVASRTGNHEAVDPGNDPRQRNGDVGGAPRTGPWREYHLDGWKPPPTRSAVVLDPFSGTGTTPMVARALGRIGIGVDLSMPYSRAARWRVHHDTAKAISRTNLERQGMLL